LKAKELIEEHKEELENLTEEERRFLAIERKRHQVYKLHKLIERLEAQTDIDLMAVVECYRQIRLLENEILRLEGWGDFGDEAASAAEE